LTSRNTDENLIITLLDKIVLLTTEEYWNGKFGLLADQLFDAREHVLYSMITFFIINYRQTGILKSYKISELQRHFAWERTQLDHYLQLAKEYIILNYTKGKYTLNLENTLVKRAWNYYFNTTNILNISNSEKVDLTSIMKRNDLLEKQIHALKKDKKNPIQIRNNTDFRAFVSEIRSILEEGHDSRDEIEDLCMKKIPSLVN